MGIGYTVRDSVTGMDAIKAQLRELPRKLAVRLEKKAINEAGKLVLQRAKAMAPVREDRRGGYKGGLLRKSLGRKVKVYRNRGIIVAIVGARKEGFRRQIGTRRDGTPIFANPTKYLHLVEAGTRHSQAQHFLRKALAEVRPQLVSIFTRVLSESLNETGRPS